jgi:hypothetical protein
VEVGLNLQGFHYSTNVLFYADLLKQLYDQCGNVPYLPKSECPLGKGFNNGPTIDDPKRSGSIGGEAAEPLGVSDRQKKRLLRLYWEQGRASPLGFQWTFLLWADRL